MTSFGWKRKARDRVSQSTSQAFQADVDDSEDHAITSGEVDWLCLAPQKRCMMLEDGVAKSNRLKEEGEVLTDSERYWEALRKWDAALQLTPDNYHIVDMKAQAYMMLNEIYPAVQAAEKTIEMNALWWVGHQTLGRAKLGLGEVRMAIKCFSRAIHINPANRELWEEDLIWSVNLLQKKHALEKQLMTDMDNKTASAIQISEITEQEDISSTHAEDNCPKSQTLHAYSYVNIARAKHYSQNAASDQEDNVPSSSTTSKNLKHVPKNYVFMRDIP